MFDAFDGVSDGALDMSGKEAKVKNVGHGDLRGEITDNCALLLNAGPLSVSCCPLFPCPLTNGYARAKLANILYVHELQRVADVEALSLAGEDLLINPGANLSAVNVTDFCSTGTDSDSSGGESSNNSCVVRSGTISGTKSDKKNKASSVSDKVKRLVTAVVHPGTVHTDIHPMLGSYLMKPFLRSAEQAANLVVYAALSEDFVPSSYIDALGFPHDLQGYVDVGIHQTLYKPPEANYNVNRVLKTNDDKAETEDTIAKSQLTPTPIQPQPFRWTIKSPIESYEFDKSLFETVEKAHRSFPLRARLWEVTESILQAWEQTEQKMK